MNHRSQRTRCFQFPNTQWELVERAKSDEDDEQQRALEELCHLYWLPLYSFVRRRGQSPADAEDATQGFLASFLKRGDFGRTRPQDGKMRTFLLRSFTNFLNCEYRFQSRIKRGGGIANLSIQDMESEGRYQDLPLEGTTPESLFDRAWAVELLVRITDNLENSFSEKGKEEEFQLLRPFLIPTGDEAPHKTIAEQLGIEVQALKTRISRLRQTYREQLHEHVKGTLIEGSDVDEEMNALISILGENFRLN